MVTTLRSWGLPGLGVVRLGLVGWETAGRFDWRDIEGLAAEVEPAPAPVVRGIGVCGGSLPGRAAAVWCVIAAMHVTSRLGVAVVPCQGGRVASCRLRAARSLRACAALWIHCFSTSWWFMAITGGGGVGPGLRGGSVAGVGSPVIARHSVRRFALWFGGWVAVRCRVGLLRGTGQVRAGSSISCSESPSWVSGGGLGGGGCGAGGCPPNHRSGLASPSLSAARKAAERALSPGKGRSP